MIVVGMLEVLNQTGQKLVIIRHLNPDKDDYDTCWSISVLIGLGIAAAIVVLAPVSRWYFHDGRVVPVMECLALRSAIGGFENVGVLDFRRNFEFEKLFRYNLYPKLITFFVTISLAVVLRNYWALVIGMVVFVLVGNLLSYRMHAYRPRFSLMKLNEVWKFSSWTLFRTIGWYLNFQVDLFAIGGVSGAAAMGRYSVATDVASSPSQELNDPIVATLYPVMSKVQNDAPQLRTIYLRVLCWSAIVCASTSAGVALVAHDIVQLVLGSKWLSLEPLMGWLALSAGILGLSSGAYSTFDALGIPQYGARMQWLRLVLLCLAIAPVALLTRNLELIAITRFGTTLIFMPTLFLAVGRTIDVSAGDYIGVFWRPFLATVVMVLAVSAINLTGISPGAARLIVDIFAGTVVFGASLFLFWWLSGYPDSPEKDVLGFVKRTVATMPKLGRAGI
jgi:O-antigen/teichoic acid export membrane protein